MKVTKIATLSDESDFQGSVSDYMARMLLNHPDLGANTNNFGITATIPVLIGKGPSARALKLDICLPTSMLEMQQTQPVSLGHPEPFCIIDGRERKALFLFKRQLFEVSTRVVDEAAFEEAVLTIKKLVYADDTRLARLRQEVQAIETVVNQQLNKRAAIAESVKLLVWERDEGKCVRCGSSEKLHFDHIIPVSKGGGVSENNIQILCERCNLQKSDRIGF